MFLIEIGPASVAPSIPNGIASASKGPRLVRLLLSEQGLRTFQEEASRRDRQQNSFDAFTFKNELVRRARKEAVQDGVNPDRVCNLRVPLLEAPPL
jgi:hypothetical protein